MLTTLSIMKKLIKSKRIENHIMLTLKKGGAATITTDKVDFKTNNITSEREYLVIIKRSIIETTWKY